MANKCKKHPATVGFVALGCPKNIVDSEKMLANIGQSGFVLTGDTDNADVVVINTCGFIAPAKAEAIDAITHAIEQKKKGSVGKVIVTGCLTQRMGRTLLDEVAGIDTIVGLGWNDKIAQIIKDTLSAANSESVYLQQSDLTTADDRARLLLTPKHWAYLRISEGCNRKCSFCTIPAIRGKFRSKPQQLIFSEADELVSSGVVELNIIAQDSNFYGKDLQIKNGLSKLVETLERIDRLRWIRLMYLYPAGIDEKLIETITNSEKVLNYIDMPIQHINDNILKKMKRSDRKEKTVGLIEKLRTAMPDVILRTTVIVGFPGETDTQFQELLDFLQWAKFDALGCFKFYPEPATPAAKLSGQISDHVKTGRFDRLMLTQQKIAFDKAKQTVAKQFVCLVDSVDEDRNAQGRFYGQAPQIDSICYIKNCTAQPGDFITAKVIDTKDYDLIAEQI